LALELKDSYDKINKEIHAKDKEQGEEMLLMM
jgi:hypothetical protein